MLEELCKRIQQLIQHCCATLRRSRNKHPTLLRYSSAIMEQKKCWELLAEKFDRFPTLRNNTQQYPTTWNRMCKRTQHVTLNNVGSCWSTIWRLLARSLKPRPNGRNFVGNNSQHCWMLHDASVCTPCCMLLDVVAQSLKPVKLFSQQLPTFLLFRTYGLFPDEG